MSNNYQCKSVDNYSDYYQALEVKINIQKVIN